MRRSLMRHLPFSWAFLALVLGSFTFLSLPACGSPLGETTQECSNPTNCQAPADGSNKEAVKEAAKESPLPDSSCLGDSCASEPCASCEAIKDDATQEPPPAEQKAESGLPDGSLEPAPEETTSEKVRPPEERTTEGQRPEVAEIRPEASPESKPEAQPEQGPRLQAKAVSVLSPRWEDSPQSGLMERLPQADRFALTVVLPGGTTDIAFRLETQTQLYGRLLTAQGTWPASGDLSTTAKYQTLYSRDGGRFRFEVDLAKGTFSVTKEVDLVNQVAVRLEGDWDGKTGQIANPLPNSALDGFHQFPLTLKKGTFRFVFSIQEAGQWKPYAARYPPHKPFPQGGSLIPQGQIIEAEIPQDDQYLVTFDRLRLRYHLNFAPDDPEARYNQLLTGLKPISSTQIKNDRITAFLRRLTALRQVPIIKPTAAIFLLMRPAMVGSVYVSGSFNQWATNQAKMEREPGTDFYHLKVNLPTPDHYAYKFVDSATAPTWITDPLNRAFEYGPFGENSVVNLPASGKSHLERFVDFQATQLNNKRAVYLYLPPQIQASASARYPVIYMHDGQNLFDPQAIWGGWGVKERADQMIQAGQMKPTIVVGPANTPDRMEEYTHAQDRISGTTLVGGKAPQYADFLIRDLKPVVDGLYPTKPEYRNTATMGSSLGGLISLWLGVRYPDVFFRIGALSSTYGWGKIGATNPTLGEIIQQEAYKNLVIYTDSGSPQDNYQVTLQMRSTLEAKGYVHDLSLRHWTETGASHNEQAWKARLDRPFSFLLAWP